MRAQRFYSAIDLPLIHEGPSAVKSFPVAGRIAAVRFLY